LKFIDPHYTSNPDVLQGLFAGDEKNYTEPDRVDPGRHGPPLCYALKNTPAGASLEAPAGVCIFAESPR
jgi:hypothetical protein